MLPKVLWQYISTYLSFKDIISLRQVSKTLNKIDIIFIPNSYLRIITDDILLQYPKLKNLTAFNRSLTTIPFNIEELHLSAINTKLSNFFINNITKFNNISSLFTELNPEEFLKKNKKLYTSIEHLLINYITFKNKEYLKNFNNLKSLRMTASNLEYFPKTLVSLAICNCSLLEPSAIFHLDNLTYLNASYTKINKFPLSLKILKIRGVFIEFKSIINLINLEELICSCNLELPKNIKILDIFDNKDICINEVLKLPNLIKLRTANIPNFDNIKKIEIILN